MKDIKIIVSDEELNRIAIEIAEEMGVEFSDAPDNSAGQPVFPELKEAMREMQLQKASTQVQQGPGTDDLQENGN